MTDSQRLLADYAVHGSEPAFRELVSRYLNLVYSTAVRLVDGDTHLADDVSQIVFTDLARLARTLPKEVMLGGWLHRHTCFVAVKAMRGNRRRRFRERQAAEMNSQQDHSAANLAQVAPILDDAINQLEAQDRAAILLRFFEQRDLRAVGETLGTSENAAQKRVARALEELRNLLQRRGVALSATGLATALAGEAVTAAPAGLAISISSAALAGATAAGGTTLTLLKLMTITKLKAGIISAVVVAGVATPLVMQHQAQVKLRDENQLLRQQITELTQLKTENERLSNLLAQANRSSLTKDELSELMKLRGEVGLLRKQSNEAQSLRAQIRQLKSLPAGSTQGPQPAEADSEVEPENQQAIAKLNYAKAWTLAFFLYAENNQGRVPASLDQALPYLPEEARTEGELTRGGTLPNRQKFGLTPDRFEIVYSGTLADIPNPASVIVCREKQAWGEIGSWNRAYGFADGHSEIHHSQDGSFDEWERQHMIVPGPPGQ
jgi:RNA polymerase sigma factor (sigma-70 family)